LTPASEAAPICHLRRFNGDDTVELKVGDGRFDFFPPWVILIYLRENAPAQLKCLPAVAAPVSTHRLLKNCYAVPFLHLQHHHFQRCASSSCES
jgi:hypothetical protein